ncbi:MAG: Ig-like domain-containing protein [Christensenellales bacterium]
METYKLNGVVENTSGLIQENPRLNGFDANLEATGDPAIVYIYKLGSGSSAIDKGLDVGPHSGVTVPGTDQLGTARPKGAGVDIGAFEAVVCTVTYDKNGGGGEDMTPAAAVVGVPFELPACTFTPPAGNQFKAWAIGSVGGTQVNAGNTYTFDADSTVFALWEPVNYQVKVNGGTSTPPNSAAYNTPVTITANTPSGQRFIGWTVVSGGASLADASAATTTFTMPASDVEITANFENIPVTGVTLTPPTLTLTVGGAATLQATVAPPNAANQNVTWSSDKPAIAAVDNGVVTAVSVGTATITVTTAEGSHQATCTVTVNPVAVTGVKLNKASTALVVGGTETLYATVEPATATNRNVTWSSDKPAIATVDNGGKVTAVGVGQATITVKTDDGNKTAACQVTVSATAVPVTGVKLNKASTALVVGGMETLYATVEPATATNRNVTWSSDKPAIATVDNGGKVTAVGVGQATITVKTDDGNKTATCTVTVSATAVPVTGVKLNKNATALVVGGMETLYATVEPATATNRNVTWSSDKSAVATVDAAGRVTAVGVGQATITVKTDDGNKTAACQVTVSVAGAQYTTVSGDGQTHTRGDGEDLLLTVKRNIGDEKTFGLFRQMLKDGVPVAESNYTRAAGSLIIRLKSAWLDTLAAGLHHLSFVFEDGEARASFTIRARPGSFEDVTTPSDSFTFTKRWQGGTGKSIDWTLYDEMDRVAHKLFNKKVVSSTEWRYNAWFDRPVSRYVVEKPVSGYKTRYENVGVYAGITDRCCDGGAIINYKIPKTGDEANLALWAGLALLGLAGISAVLVTGRRRRKGK